MRVQRAKAAERRQRLVIDLKAAVAAVEVELFGRPNRDQAGEPRGGDDAPR